VLFQRYIYTGELDLDEKNVMSTLYAAKKYQLPGLETGCEESLLKGVSWKNAIQLLPQVIVVS